jgi:peptide-methionine (S)-S-oxide reductase
MKTIGLGGSCHWCTEGIFSSVRGVAHVDQGWISSSSPNEAWSEGVRLNYDPEQIGLEDLVAIHLHSHSCTNVHSMREKYRSAVYVVEANQQMDVERALDRLQREFEKPIITAALTLVEFKLNEAHFLDYYYSDTSRPFCRNYISPKLRLLLERFPQLMDERRLAHINEEHKEFKNNY